LSSSKSRYLTAIFVALLNVAAPQSGHAGISAFIAGCMANVGDFSPLPIRLESSGMTEIDPAQGPQFPAPSPERSRLWKSTPAAGVRGEAFTGYIATGGDTPAEVCWHISRPGESATIALNELKRRYPPTAGKSSQGPFVFYGGYEQWETQIDGQPLTIGVNWPTQANPSEGTSMMYVLKLRADRPAR
jgi:hypothetical protein